MRDRVCIVTGASRGIGRRLALDLAREGARVALVARRSAKLDEALTEVRASSPASVAIACDVRDPAAVGDLVAGVAAAWGRVDVLVNSAGIEPIASVIDASVEEIDETIRTNFFGMVHCVKAVLPIMRRQRHGSIVTLSSSAAWFPLPRGAAYCASKAAITAFSESLYAEVHQEGIQVLVVYPGFVAETDMAQAHLRARGAPPRFVHQTLAQVSAAVRAAIGTDAARIVLPRGLGWSLVVRDLFPELSLRQAARLQA
jgi:NAD(P)-dependent dehydrogenase (short-subunit alcohol dehydrogenase family)